jgi:hypothetical protein
MTIKTFRGLLGDGSQERIRLEHRDGKVGYKIIKFELFPYQPGQGANETESIFKIYSIKQTVVDRIVDFSEQTLLAAGFVNNYTDAQQYPVSVTTVFDSVTFNQDIFVTHENGHADSVACNYYLELELRDLDDSEATATILKNFRNTNSYAT